MGNLVFQATLGGQVNLVGPNTASTFNLNVPAVSSTLATLTGTETFTNKTLTSPTLTTPVLGTPSSGTLTSCTGLPLTTGVTGTLAVTNGGTGVTTSTGSGNNVLSTSPTLTTPVISSLSSASATALTLQSAGTTAITVDTSQNVGIGNTSPSGYKLAIGDGSSNRGRIMLKGATSGNYPEINIDDSMNTSGKNYQMYSTGGVLKISNQTDATVSFVSNAFGIGLGDIAAVDGTGIRFPATQSASSNANTLDDYEEGTWTPTLKFGGGTTGITYSQQFGQYTKIGRLVTCTFNIFLTSKGSSTGSASIDGLPFTVFNGSGYYAGTMLQPYKINYVDGGMITMYVDKPSSALYLQSIPDTGAANTDIASGDFNNDSQVIGSFIYYV